MNKNVKARLLRRIQQDLPVLHFSWQQRLRGLITLQNSDPDRSIYETLHLIRRDLLRALEGKIPTLPTAPTVYQMQVVNDQNLWRPGLCESLEVFLAGEETLREWLREQPDFDSAEKLDGFDEITHAFHLLFGFYALQYCTSCSAALQTRAQESARIPEVGPES